MVLYGPVYSCMIPLKSRMVQYYSTLPYLVLYSPIWSHVRPFLFLFCPVWPHMILYSTVISQKILNSSFGSCIYGYVFFLAKMVKYGSVWLSMTRYSWYGLFGPFLTSMFLYGFIWCCMVLFASDIVSFSLIPLWTNRLPYGPVRSHMWRHSCQPSHKGCAVH